MQVKEPEEFTKKQADKEARKAKRQKRAGGEAATTITSFLTGTSDRLEDDSNAAQPSSDAEPSKQQPDAGSDPDAFLLLLAELLTYRRWPPGCLKRCSNLQIQKGFDEQVFM